MPELWDSELTDEETDALLRKAADQVIKRKMITPAILALEMHKPIAHIGSSSALALSPFIVPFFGFDTFNDYSRLFSKPENFERLIVMLENEQNASHE